MDDLYLASIAVLAGFGAVGFGLKMQAAAIRDLSETIEKLRDRIDNLAAPSRLEHNRLYEEVARIAKRQVEIGTELAGLRHPHRDQDGG